MILRAWEIETYITVVSGQEDFAREAGEKNLRFSLFLEDFL